jgi:hypothetical protein
MKCASVRGEYFERDNEAAMNEILPISPSTGPRHIAECRGGILRYFFVQPGPGYFAVSTSSLRKKEVVMHRGGCF